MPASKNVAAGFDVAMLNLVNKSNIYLSWDKVKVLWDRLRCIWMLRMYSISLLSVIANLCENNALVAVRY